MYLYPIDPINWFDPYGRDPFGANSIVGDVGGAGDAVSVVGAIATAAAENAGAISSGAAWGITIGTAPVGDLLFPSSLNEGEDAELAWDRHMEEIQAIEQQLQEILDRLNEICQNTGGCPDDPCK